jgi:hypothetical protein
MPARAAETVERLPFTIRVVSESEQLAKAVALRYRAYGRHVPQFAELLRLPEPNDAAEGCAVLLAESKLDGEALGTLRIQTNRFRPLALESSVTLPDYLQGRSLAEATRLGITEGRAGRVVKAMLFKAFYLYCVDAGIDWLVIGARRPLDRMYEALLFSELFPGEEMVPLKHAGNMPHRILGFEIETAEARWLAARHPMYDQFVNTRHPDIDLSGHEAAFAWHRHDERLAQALAA